jgi:hypothetical protein
MSFLTLVPAFKRKEYKPMSTTLRRSFAILGALVTVAFLATSASATPAACPNEALRGQLSSEALPDCRAYEQATPPQLKSRLGRLRGVGKGVVSALRPAAGAF